MPIPGPELPPLRPFRAPSVPSVPPWWPRFASRSVVVDLALTEAQQLVRDSIRDYLEREVPFSRVREVERGDGFDAALWKGLAGLGWLGLAFPEGLGGSGGSLVDLA